MMKSLFLATIVAISSLWADYDKAQKADKPQTQLQILESIIEESRDIRSNWDFYHAWQEKVDVGQRINWKMRQSLVQERDAAYASYNAPIINVVCGNISLDSLMALKPALVAEESRGFYDQSRFFANVKGYYSFRDALAADIANDWQFALWHALSGTYEPAERERIRKVIEKQTDYPQTAFVDFDRAACNADTLRANSDKRGVFESFDRKWSPSAATLLSGEQLLSLKMDTLCTSAAATSNEFRLLRGLCSDFESRRSSMRGSDKVLADKCRIVSSLIETLDSKDIRVTADSKDITVIFRNLASAKVSVKKDADGSALLWEGEIANLASSYYVPDSVVIPIPVIDDGEYIVSARSGGENASTSMIRHSISAALAKDADGWKIYAADYDSGRPLESYDIRLSDSGNIYGSALYEGFRQGERQSPLPEELSLRIDDKARSRQYLELSYRDADGIFRKSGCVYVTPGFRKMGTEDTDGMHAVLFKDCGAYRRGDVIHCKAVLYTGHYYGSTACASKNTGATLRFLDPDGAAISEKVLKTNDFGSIVADFAVPRDIKGGTASIQLLYKGSVIAATYARVDDYVLPDFDCSFAPIENLCFAGDSVVVSGQLKAYNGHRADVVRAYFEVEGDGLKHKMYIAPDGTFTIKVPTPGYHYWNTAVTLTVTVSSGETLQFTREIPVDRYLDLRVALENETPASLDVSDGGLYSPYENETEYRSAVLSDSLAAFKLEVFNADGVSQALETTFSVFRGDSLLEGGKTVTPCNLKLALADGEGEYRVLFECKASDGSATGLSKKIDFHIIKVAKGSTSIDADIENVFIARPEDGIAFDFAATRGPVWAVVNLYGGDEKNLYSGIVTLDGKKGNEGSMISVNLPYLEEYPDAVNLDVFYFRNGNIYRWTNEYRRPLPEPDMMTIQWDRFTDNAVPGSEYTFSISTSLPSETLVAIFDKSTEKIAGNSWDKVYTEYRSPYLPYLNSVCGRMGGTQPFMLTKAMDTMSLNGSPATGDAEYAASGSVSGGGDVRLRSDFSTTLCWAPLLNTSKNVASFKFRTSDKTGTFIVSAYAHDRKMNNEILRREMVVSLPVEVGVSVPTALREGDDYVLKAVVSSLGEVVSGRLDIMAEGLGRVSRDIDVAADSTYLYEWPVSIPSGLDTLSFTVMFQDKSGRYSDAVVYRVPVYGALQTLTESHSAVCRKESDKEEIRNALSQQFVNTSPSGAQYREVKLSDMILESLQPRSGQVGRCVTDITDAIGVNMLYTALTGSPAATDTYVEGLEACRNTDGGFAWMEGLESSPIITATVLERCARIEAVTGKSFLSHEQRVAAVQYIDTQVFSQKQGYKDNAVWLPSLSLAQYLYVRSFYADVPFRATVTDKIAEDFRKAAGEYLFPADARGLSGRIFAKVQRLTTLDNLYSSRSGQDLLQSWNLGNQPMKKVLQPLEADVESLQEYAVDHKSGGKYYPNLVMPYRGLLADEAYCHSLLCDIIGRYSPEIADGIRLWLMLQKESQHWDNNFAFTNTLASVMGGSETLKDTRVLIMTKNFEEPYRDIKAAGNGMSVSRHFFRLSEDGKSSELFQGDSLVAGDRVKAVYRIWNEENRSYVRLRVPSYACLRPVDQLSGPTGWRLKPMNVSGWSYAPQGYREVKNDAIVWWFESYPEDFSEISEEFLVTQTGVFTSPVVEIESQYAPYYRANDGFEGEIRSCDAK